MSAHPNTDSPHNRTASTPSTVIQNRQEPVLNMAGFSNFSASVQGPTMMVSIPVVFTCKHCELTTVLYTCDNAIASFMLNDGYCSAPDCQKRFVNKMGSELQLAGMNCESSLRRFGMVEPMLAEELSATGCPPDMIEALLNCSQRSAATSAYLGHRSLLSSLAEYEASANAGQASAAHAMQLVLANRIVQHKLLTMQSAVLRLSANSYPAPALKFPMLEGINSHDPSWGKQQLTTLKSTTEGRAILALPLANANILAAKSNVLAEQAQLDEMSSSSSSLQGSSTEEFVEMYIDMQDGESSSSASSACSASSSSSWSSADIRSLRPERVLSKKMAAHKCLGLDMEKIHSYSGKSYTALTNPWWGEAKKAA